MTKAEAMELQARCEKRFADSSNILADAELSMALTGRLKLSFSQGYVTFDYNNGRVDYIKYQGFIDDLYTIRSNVYNVCSSASASSDLATLYWSYEHIKDLED